jgi:hypothetical protein
VHSNVREWLGLPPALSTGSRVFRGSLTVTEESSEELRSLLDQGLVPRGANQWDGVYFVVFNFSSKYPGRLSWTLSTTKDIDDGCTPFSIVSEVISDPDELRILREIFDLSDEKHLKPYPANKVVNFSDEFLAPLDGGWGGRGRVTLIGDAAHAMRLTDGQGGNQAFEDALVLTRTLTGESSLTQALRTFEATRLPRVKRIHDDQRIKYERRMKGEQVGPVSKEFQEWIEQGV